MWLSLASSVLSMCILANWSLAFYDLLPSWSSTLALQQCVVQSHTDSHWPWSSPLIPLKVTSFTLCISSLWRFSCFLLQPFLERLAAVQWTLAYGYAPTMIWIIWATGRMNTKLPGDDQIAFACLAIIVFLISWNRSLFSFRCSMFSVIHTMTTNSTVTSFTL